MRSHNTRDLVEAAVWFFGLALMAAANPELPGLISLCPFDAIGEVMGLSFCPGCGLGHAVSHLVRGQVAASFGAHPLGIPAIAGLSIHIIGLLRGHKHPIY